ncbi:Putative multidrug export ATP-binding/permease protein [Planctomycetes bacterium Poly30]|uniref:Multidrug export ATP-binding/permease protein n=2 Tax=Saltatorellus ferox TaxID=2528018 RepID=A0A518EN04_9BACT|nr:Putative multidrug export ATP-binding/permease protein [Planctomycetes bacterium Poly30]
MGRVRLGAFYSVLNKLFDLAPPLLIGTAVAIVVEKEDSFVAKLGIEDPARQLTWLAVVTAVIWVAESIFEFLQKIVWRNLAQSVQHELRLDAYRHVQGLEMAFFEDEDTGQLMSVMNDDVNQLERFLDGGANSLIQLLTTVLAIGGIFFWLSPAVAWVAFLPMPFIIWGSILYQRKLQDRYKSVRTAVGELNADLAGNLGGIATIKSYAREEGEAERISARSDAYRTSNRAAITLSSAFSPLIRMFILAGFTATLLIGGNLALEGQLDAGSFSVLVFMTQRLLWPLTGLGETLDLYQRAMASTTRILDLVDRPSKIVGGSTVLGTDAVAGKLEMQGVVFAYPGHAPLFDGLDLTFPARSTTAIVGATGSGKSSITKLLLRFYDPGDGQVSIDGHDLRDLELRSLRRSIGLVSQDVFLFHGTIAANIAYARPDASEADIRQAAAAAELDDWIDTLPDGLQTIVGERGQKLSGGQRQRVSIARAVLKDPPILILDEATSAVDNETEAAIQRSMEHIAEDRTTIVIAHRLSTIRNADKILVLDKGRVVESGQHEELIAAGGLYAQLWAVQTGERPQEVEART